MNIFYRWLPNGASQHSYHEEHARSKISDVYPDVYFERQDDPLTPGHHIIRAWENEAARQVGEAIAEIVWMTEE